MISWLRKGAGYAKSVESLDISIAGSSMVM
nr:MAG TPA: hypothetical protein [Caudoviricetes sp.]